MAAFLLHLRFAVLVTTIITELVGLVIVYLSKSIMGNLQLYLLILFGGFLLGDLAAIVVQIGIIGSGFSTADTITILLATFTKVAQLTSMGVFVLYMLGILNGTKKSK